HLLGLDELLLRALERRLRLPALGGVLGHLGKADQLSVPVADGIDDDVGPEFRSVLAESPSLGLELPFAGGNGEAALGNAVGPGLGRVERAEMAADDLAGAIALDPLGSGVPVRHHAVGIEHEDGVVAYALDEKLEAAFERDTLLRDRRLPLLAGRDVLHEANHAREPLAIEAGACPHRHPDDRAIGRPLNTIRDLVAFTGFDGGFRRG